MKTDELVRKMTFVAACRIHFGVRPGDGLRDFVAELKALTPEDRIELTALFAEQGIDASGVS